ncbi:MAG: cation:proton antiporter [Synergistaceae bacterium]|nr:cation:proton antiporter [Synergistaceae bacterium]
MHLPQLIIDLALILIVSGITTVVFKKIRQPLVLGYIVAGFLTGPFFAVLPTVTDMESIHLWSEIGIICLMFALGLDCSFHKLANVGGAAITTSLTEVCGLFLFGFLSGHMLGWSTLDNVMLGGILSMSSTTIIIKAFEELHLMKQKFIAIVFGALILEDIVGVMMMAFMSTFALGADNNGIALTIMRLMFYLVLWLILGIYVIPTLLNHARELMSDETLLIISLGICFGMVLLFSYVGFSTALGSFVAGTILAGTVYVERIEHLLKPVKDLFGAVFFISVGMLVDPAMLVRYTWPIVVITLATIMGKLIFSSLGVLLSGRPLYTAICCGASLAQIGEFAFIIASLGISLKLSSDFIYPVVVSVSVITTFTTPFFIKNTDIIYELTKKIIPSSLLKKIDKNVPEGNIEKEKEKYWRGFLKGYFTSLSLKVIMLFGIFQAGIHFIEPFIKNYYPKVGGELLTTSIILLCMSPFLSTLLSQRDKNFPLLLMKSKVNRLPLFMFLVARITITVFIIKITLDTFLSISTAWLIVPVIVFMISVSRSDWFIGKYLEIEARFLANFNEKRLLDESMQSEGEYSQEGGMPRDRWINEQLWVTVYSVEKDCNVIGHTLRSLKWGYDYKVNVIKIISGKKHLNIPEGRHKLHVNDTLFLMCTREQIELFELAAAKKHTGLIKQKDPVMLRDFISDSDNELNEDRMFCHAITVKRGLRFVGKNLKESKMRTDFYCDVIGIHRGNYPIIYPDVQFVMNKGDQIWLLGGHKMVSRLKMEGIIP